MLIMMIMQIRLALYFFGVLSEDEETQRHGFVFIYTVMTEGIGDAVEDFQIPENRREYEKLNNCMPVRTSALHFCLDQHESSPSAANNILFLTLRAFVVLMLKHNTRVRARVHQGALIQMTMRIATSLDCKQIFQNIEETETP
jgi:hypothetical protein